MIWGEKTTTQQAIDMDLYSVKSASRISKGFSARSHVPTDAAESLNVQVRALRWREHDAMTMPCCQNVYKKWNNERFCGPATIARRCRYFFDIVGGRRRI